MLQSTQDYNYTQMLYLGTSARLVEGTKWQLLLKAHTQKGKHKQKKKKRENDKYTGGEKPQQREHYISMLTLK